MTKRCKVTFEPDGASVEVHAGTTILAAGNEAGVYVNSLCGGDGVCGRCRVIVRKGKTSGGSTEFFTREEIQQGYILACQGRIESDLIIEVPPETRQIGAPQYVEQEVPHLADLSKQARRTIRLRPLVRKTYVELPPPSLDNNVSDLQRLEQVLGKSIRTQGFQMGLKVTRRLPEVLRKGEWKVTAVTGHRGPLTEIVDVEAGDATGRNMCIAADIGTTTVVCHLVDLRDGHTLGQAAKYNSQAGYGADVIRRIIYATQSRDNENTLREAIIGDLNELIGELIAKYRIGSGDVSLISVAGNTTMLHLMLGLPAEGIRKEPYTGAAYRLPPFRAAELGLKIHPRGLLYCLPCVAGFVGGDIISGIFATGMAQGEQVRMLIDIGTNGEIVVGNKEFLVCASASAGPAFEGAECQSGMRATRGALDHIRLLNADNVLNYSTIGSAPPVGICGTGYVDLIAEMLRVGLIDKTGRLSSDKAPSRLRTGRDGQMEYIIIPAAQRGPKRDPSRLRTSDGGGNDLVISQSDISNILRAKGAIYAAATVLLNALSMTFDDIAEIMVAGAFGNFLNVRNAVFLGLLPDISPERMRFVGNTSLAGAKLSAICEDCYDEIFRIAERTTYFELSTAPTFMEQFVSACFFPHTNVELFPSVMAEMESRNET